MIRIDHDARRAAVALLKAGSVSIAEATQLAGVSRQTMHYWASCDAPEWQRARQERLTRLWAKEMGRQRSK